MGRSGVVLLLGALLGCGGGGGPGTDAEAPDAAGPAAATPPAPVDMTPCAGGWREVAVEGATLCEPWPGGGPVACPEGEIQLPGDAECAPVGAACPTGDFADDLPTDGSVVFVSSGATGGDGTRALPFGTIATALSRAGAGAVVALAKGAYDEAVLLPAGLAVRGACAAETTLTSTVSDPMSAVLRARGDGEVSGVRVVGARRLGVLADAAGRTLHLEGVVIDDCEILGVAVINGSRVTATELHVRGTRAHPSGYFGRGITVEQGSAAEIRRAAFEQNLELGAYAGHAGTTLLLEDVVIRDTQARALDLRTGRGLGVEDGAAVELRRVASEDNREHGVYVSTGSTALAEHLVVRRTRSRARDRRAGRGLHVDLSSAVEVRGGLLEGNRDLGAFALGAGSALTISDLVVRDTQPNDADGFFGRGIAVESGATAAATRVLLEGNHSVGLYTSETGTVARFEDLRVRDTVGQAAFGVFGRGLNAQEGALLEVDRAVIERNREVAVSAMDPETRVELVDAVVTDTLRRACADTTCADAPAGMGLGSYLGAAITASRFAVERSSLCGAQLARDGTVDLVEGEVSGNEIGACIQVEGFDVARLTTEVRYRDNGMNLEVTELPIPDSIPPQEVGDA